MPIAAAEISFSIGTWAVEAGMTRDVLRRILSERGVQPAGKRGGHPVYRARDVIAALISNGEAADDPDKLKPWERKAHYQAEHEKLRLQVERGELVPSIEVEQEMAAMAKRFIQTLDTLPDLIERDVGAHPALLERIERAIDKERETLFEDLNKDAEDDGAGRAAEDGE
jgi:phage terminase Nu1 subunit (DNA packaging protein)